MSPRARFMRRVSNAIRDRKPGRSSAGHSSNRRLHVESLEDRRVLAVFTVTNLNDFFVDSAGDAPGTLRQAIFDANSTPAADTIQFAPSLTSEGAVTILLEHGELDITRSLTINGPGADLLTIDASASDVDTEEFGNGSRIFDVNDNISGNLLNVSISGLTLTGADSFADGGAIRSLENLTLTDSVVTGNQSGRGGGLYNGAGTMQIIGSTIDGNNNDGPQNGHRGSGITNWTGTLVVTNSTISDNGFTVCDVCGSLRGGAGIYNHRGSVIVAGSAITGNSGGGIYSDGLDAAADVTITDSTISDNLTGWSSGNGLNLSNTVSSIQNSLINDNEARGIYSRFGNLTIEGCTISGNAGFEGAGIRNVAADLTISETTISGNTATENGGGIYHGEGNLSITSSTISGNSAGNEGGGLRLLGAPSLNKTMLISNSTISGNTAAWRGGGLWVRTFSGNSFGLVHSTVTGNTADPDSIFGGEGGGLFFFYSYGADAIDHSIVAGNSRGNGDRDDIQGDVAAQFSLIGDNTGATITDNGGNLIGTGGLPIDPRLAPLADNGGPTMTHRLQIASSAIDAGDEDAVAGVGGVPEFDQRGNPFSRVFDGNGDSTARIDIGAFESNTAALIVDNLADESDGDYSEGDLSLREAIELSNASAAIEAIGFDESLNGETITLTLGHLAITAAVFIDASGFDEGLTVDASGNDLNPAIIDGFGTRVFVVDDGDTEVAINVEITGLTIRGGDDANSGGGVFNNERLTLVESIVTGNAAQWGGGIYNAEYGDLTVIDSLVTGNTATGTGSGGGIYNWGGAVSVIDSTISQNVAPAGAGVRNNLDGVMSLLRTTVSDNIAIGSGGGVFNNGDTLNIVESLITGNSADSGAGLYNAYGSLNVSGSTISYNLASNGGGANNLFGDLTITGSNIFDNSANYGGGVFNDLGTLIVEDTRIEFNNASDGAGLYNAEGDAQVVRSTVSGNTASNNGGGVFAWLGNVSIAESTLSTNVANYGGGLYVAGDVTFFNTTVTNSTISSNYASLAGGGVYNFQGNLLIAHSTIAYNEAPADQGSGVYTWADPFTALTTVYSSIIATNVNSDVDEDPLGPTSFVSEGYNLIGTGFAVDSFTATGDQTGELEPGLGPLQDNGGPTFTHALQSGSPAIDMGDPGLESSLDFDQRGLGFDRVRDGDGANGSRIDIGAFEVQTPAAPELRGDYNQDGTVNSADYVVWRKFFGATGLPPYASADGNGDTTINNDDYDVWTENFGESNAGAGGTAAELPSEGQQLAALTTEESNLSGGGGGVPVKEIVIDSVVFTDPYGNNVGTPVVGQKVYVRASWHYSGLDFSDQYIVRFNMDGVLVESSVITGTSGTNVPYSWWHGGWIATPGSHTITVTVDAANAVTESNESNNALGFNFTPAAPALAQKFITPVAGTQSVDWVIEGYVDTDPVIGFEDFADYQGRGATYDGHNGTDFALPHFAAMDAGVAVRAAAAGTVSFVSDGQYDRWLSPPFPYPDGNYVVIDHGNGWKTWYFHLRRDSVGVAVGQSVVAGQQIGLVGSSGYSLRPHLHFEVTHDNTPVDPFTAPSDYFLSPLPYTFDAPKKLLDFGFTNVAPPFQDIAEHVSDIDVFPSTANPIFFQAWAIFASLEAGDTWEVQLFRPNGTLYSDFPAVVVTADRAWEWSYWFADLPANPALGIWRADWIINGVVVAQKDYAVSSISRPEIRVYRDDALDLYGTPTDELIIDGRTTPIDFGTHDKLDPAPTRTFTVQNHGYAALDISAVDLPFGYTLVEPLASTIAAGASDTFTVRLETSVPGYKLGEIVIHSIDFSELTTTFRLEGTVLPTLPGDFNNDNAVSGADYVVWQKFFGTPSVPAYYGPNGNADSAVDNADYNLWRANYGQSNPAGAGGESSLGASSTEANAVSAVFDSDEEFTAASVSTWFARHSETRSAVQQPAFEARQSTAARERAFAAWLAALAANRASEAAQVGSFGNSFDVVNDLEFNASADVDSHAAVESAFDELALSVR